MNLGTMLLCRTSRRRGRELGPLHDLNEKTLHAHKPPRFKLLCDPFEAIEEVAASDFIFDRGILCFGE